MARLGGDEFATIQADVIDLAVEVVAEAVETEAQRAALVDISSKTKGQGFYTLVSRRPLWMRP